MISNLRTKEAIKTAPAMTIAYGIALSMDWDRPYWAGFAVAVISLSTVGQSLNKGAMRMLGTLVAVGVSLTLIALFPQQRWWFMLALSIFVGLCTYLMGGTKRQYFWLVAGFATVVISLFDTLADIKGFGSATAQVGDAPRANPAFCPTPIALRPPSASWPACGWPIWCGSTPRAKCREASASSS